MKKQAILMMLIVVLMVSCTAVPVEITKCVSEKPVGFWMGLWHGLIAPITFIISLFTDSIEMYAVNNNGGWYNFGFVLGAGILFRGSSKAGREYRRKRSHSA